MRGLLVRALGNFVAVLIAANLLPSYIGYESVAGVLIFAVILALLNAFLKPLLALLTMPITCLTLGFFIVVLNAFLFWLAALLSGGDAVWVNGAAGALLGALIVSLTSFLVARFA